MKNIEVKMNNKDKNTKGLILTNEEIKERLLLMMRSIDKFCRANNFKYYMLGGTLLGAIRHKGYIPWDDDIDIGIPRVDYEKFCKLYNDEQNNYSLICIDNCDNYYLPFAKVIDNDISLQEDIHGAPEIGLYLDVFPLDYVKLNNDNKSTVFGNKLLRNIETLKYININGNRPLWKNMLVYLARCIYPISLHDIAHNRERRALAVSCKKDTGWIANIHGAWGEKEIVKSSFFGDGKEYIFEGYSFYGPVNYDGYLTSLYGDYMTPPPVEKRITHHGFVAKWK